jgi:hypothetical protein
MQGVELSTSACDGHVVVALHGELDVTSAAEAEAAISVDAGVASIARRQRRLPLAAACGAHCTPWEGSAIAYWHRVTAAGVRAGPESSVPGRTRR